MKNNNGAALYSFSFLFFSIDRSNTVVEGDCDNNDPTQRWFAAVTTYSKIWKFRVKITTFSLIFLINKLDFGKDVRPFVYFNINLNLWPKLR